MAAGQDDNAATNSADKTADKPFFRLVVYNKAGGDVVGADVTADSFMDFKRRRGKHTAMVVELTCGEEIFVLKCTLFRKLPRGATYRARLMQRTSQIPDGLAREASGHNVWVEV